MMMTSAAMSTEAPARFELVTMLYWTGGRDEPFRRAIGKQIASLTVLVQLSLQRGTDRQHEESPADDDQLEYEADEPGGEAACHGCRGCGLFDDGGKSSSGRVDSS